MKKATQSMLLAILVLFVNSLSAQNCQAPVGLTHDSVTTTMSYYSWDPVPGVRSYKVEYSNSTFASAQVTNSTTISFPKPTTPGDFELFAVKSICDNGEESVPASILDGGIVVTVDIIFRKRKDCFEPSGGQGYVFFEDLCMYTHFDDLCTAMAIVEGDSGLPNPNESSETTLWGQRVVDVLSNGEFLWNPWDNPDGCSQSLRRGFIANNTYVNISPNPFSSSFQFSVHLEVQEEARIEIIDAMGKKIQTHSFTAPFSGTHSFTNWGSELAAGFYYLAVTTAEGVQTLPFQKSK